MTACHEHHNCYGATQKEPVLLKKKKYPFHWQVRLSEEAGIPSCLTSGKEDGWLFWNQMLETYFCSKKNVISLGSQTRGVLYRKQ